MFERAIGGLSGMYGDLQGIFGMTMPELDDVGMKTLVPPGSFVLPDLCTSRPPF